MKRKDRYINEVFRKRLSDNSFAEIRFGTLSSEQKDKIKDYIKDSGSKEEASSRSEELINSLNDSEKMWFYD